ncbi:MAG: metal ABC transporter permease, partial [Chloroflexi bacterium]|nr:metal ABC transporter permease [Chloroflexota bacterium]
MDVLSVVGAFFDYTLRNVILGSAILGIVGGALGSFAVLRRQSLLGDALAHAALPGICLVFLLTHSKTPELLLLGAGLSGWIGTLLLLAIVRGTRVKEDAALGTVLTVFFGFGILLLTVIQKTETASQSGLDRYLFGQASTLLERDIVVMGVLGGVALGIMALSYKELKLLAFDREYAASLGLPTVWLDVLLTSLIVVAVLIGLQTVGVVLMVAMLIAPAAAARQWTNRLGTMIALSAAFGALAGCVGAVLSATAVRTPTGPLIILAATSILIVSILFAPKRGILWHRLRLWRQRRRLAATHILAEIHGLLTARLALSPAQTALDELVAVPFAPADIAGSRHHSTSAMRSAVGALARRGLARRLADGRFALTATGAAEAVRAARNQHLWQTYLAHQLELPEQDVHLDIGDLERVLAPEIVARLEAAAAIVERE